MSFMHSFMRHHKDKTLIHCTEVSNVSSRQFENLPIMTISNFALGYHIDIDHWVIYHLKYVCEMCRRRLNHFSWINVFPRGVIIDVNVNFDTWIAWLRQTCGWLLLRQNVRVVNFSITHDYLVPSLSYNVSRSSGNSNLNIASVTSNFGLDLRQFDGTASQSLRFLQNMVLRVIFVDWFQHNYTKLLLE